MPIILHIETSAAICSVSLANDGEFLCEERGEVVNDHIAQITTLIEKACSTARITLQQLDAVAVGSGPGSYTGLRIGASTAKGICSALNIPLIAVNSLHSMVYGVLDTYKHTGALLCPLIDARRLEVYTLICDDSGHIKRAQEPYILQPGLNFSNYLANNKVVFFGSGLQKSKPYLEHPNAVFHEDYTQHASSMHFLAKTQFIADIIEDIAYFEPDYIKEFYTTLKIK